MLDTNPNAMDTVRRDQPALTASMTIARRVPHSAFLGSRAMMHVDTEGHTGTNNSGASLLFIASRAGHIAAVEFLLAHGASVDVCHPKGATPLLIASQENNPAVVALLLGAGASVDLSDDDGWTPLHIASRGNSIEASKHLGGAGVAPLNSASQANSIDVMKHLLAAGASRDLAKAQGYTPLAVTKHYKHTAAVELLEAHLIRLMVALVMRKLLYSGEDPTVTRQYRQHTLSALTLAGNSYMPTSAAEDVFQVSTMAVRRVYVVLIVICNALHCTDQLAGL